MGLNRRFSHAFIRTVCALVTIVLLASFSHAQVELQPKMGSPLDGLSTAELAAFIRGKDAFEHVLTEAEGLGPIFNDISCASCHSQGAIGGASIGLSMAVTRFGMLTPSGDFDPMTALGGSLLQRHSTDPSCSEVVPTTADVEESRIPTPIFGLGLVEAIADADITALEMSSDPSISGRAHMVDVLEEPGVQKVGRFGWKASLATSLSFAADAALNESGITSSILPTENAPNGDRVALAMCDTVADPENFDFQGVGYVEALNDFQRFLAPPPQTPKSGMTGETIFNDVGCANCHTASFTTPDDTSLESALRNKTIKPYSNFLLHDMASAGDGIEQDGAERFEMRTAPLWGIAARSFWMHGSAAFGGGFPCVPSSSSCPQSFMDGFVDSLRNGIRTAVEQHAVMGSEAQTIADEYLALPIEDETAVALFFRSLGRAEFDYAFDNVIDQRDLQFMIPCKNEISVMPDDDCSVFDVDQNEDVNEADFDLFLTVYEPGISDCDCDGIEDQREVFLETEVDVDEDGIPDSCSTLMVPCVNFRRGDANGDSAVDLSDVIAILVALFVSPGADCLDAHDANDSGDLDISDPVSLLNYLFDNGSPPPAPGSITPGPDLTVDALFCTSYPSP